MTDRSGQSGYVSIGYALLTAIMVIAFFAPVPGMEGSLVDWVLDALKKFQANTTYLMSLP